MAAGVRASWLLALPGLLLAGTAAAQQAAPSRQPQAALVQYPDPNRTAALEGRIAQLEDDLRRMTGRVEELEHGQRQTQARLDKLLSDIDARLGQVEQGGAAGQDGLSATPGRTGPQVAGRNDPAAPPRPPAPAPPGGAPEPDASAARGYVLGTIPHDVARNAPQGAPAPAGSQGASRPAAITATGYDGAVALLQAGRWDEAERQFKDFLDKTPDDPRASSAAYWLAESYYVRKDYGDAAAAFAKNYRTYGATAPRAPDNLLKLGMSLNALGDKDKACQTFDELGKRHPDAPAPVRQALTRERGSAGCARG